MSFEIENSTFEKSCAQWIDDGHEGKWVLIKGSEVIGLYDTVEAVYLAGAKAFGNDQFLVRQILRYDEPKVVHRFLVRRQAGGKESRPQ